MKVLFTASNQYKKKVKDDSEYIYTCPSMKRALSLYLIAQADPHRNSQKASNKQNLKSLL